VSIWKQPTFLILIIGLLVPLRKVVVSLSCPRRELGSFCAARRGSTCRRAATQSTPKRPWDGPFSFNAACWCVAASTV
jgi:hypothetical protein